MNRSEFRDSLLRVVKHKEHWAWSAFVRGQVAEALLPIHLQQEYATYVRDFPVLLGRAYVQCGQRQARRILAEHLFELETGSLSGSGPHEDLFLACPRGLGMNMTRFQEITLLPKAAEFRAVLDRATCDQGWEVAAAVTILFLEGSEGGFTEAPLGRRPIPVRPSHQSPSRRRSDTAAALTRAGCALAGSSRREAWHLMLDLVTENARPRVLQWMGLVSRGWQHYRDDVARACGLADSASVSR
ncbi:hypothetical protein [Microbulbifer sp. TYP-18]|uniref:hypothetical protein n=1 Tax=Microbulbifer sp. TYP-18 TaxID=3230024 RepID=UPI0034C6B58C